MKERRVRTAENQEVDVVAIRLNPLTTVLLVAVLCFPLSAAAQDADDDAGFKRRVLEATELSILTSYYGQDGDHAAVTGGIGSEDLTDVATYVNLSIPVKSDGVLSISGTVSAYTSASSSNLNPWSGIGDDDDDDDDDRAAFNGAITGTPWVASSGASRQDVWTNVTLDYSHSSDDRNTIVSGNASFANEYDYVSFGFGAGAAKVFNNKNTEIDLSGTVYLDTWKPEYPIEIRSYVRNSNTNAGLLAGVDVLDQNGNAVDKNATTAWRPFKSTLVDDSGRNTYALSLSLSQILTKSTQASVFTDLTFQSGWLANPMQRVYFADRDDFYVGNADDISNYTNDQNRGVFQLADDIERLPDSRYKLPIGVRLNQYVNEWLVLRSFYRYYADDWGLTSSTINMELAIKVTYKFTLYPSYRYYTQSAVDYYAPYNENVSTSAYYTSDDDLSAYDANQFGLGVKYTDIFASSRIWSFGIKELTLDYNHYSRNTSLNSNIISFGANFVLDR